MAEYTAAMSAGLAGSLGAFPIGGAQVTELPGVCHPHVRIEKVSLSIITDSVTSILCANTLIKIKYELL